MKTFKYIIIIFNKEDGPNFIHQYEMHTLLFIFSKLLAKVLLD